jgi:hypothetical protein
MAVSEIDTKSLAKIITNYLKVQVLGQDGLKKSYLGNIPINLDAPFNMGEKALDQCHPELDMSWMQLLAQLTFTISWQDDIPTFIMNYYNVIHYDTHNFSYSAESPSSIQLKILVCGIDTSQYKTIRALIHDVFKNIMIEFVSLQDSKQVHPDCICLAIWDGSAEQNESNNKRKRDDMEP